MVWPQRLVAAVSLLSSGLAFAGLGSNASGSDEHSVYRATGRGFGAVDTRPFASFRAAVAGATTGQNGIAYHGGPLMTNATNIYLIWYGDWTSSAKTKQVLTSFGTSLTGSTLYNTNSSYTDSSKRKVQNIVQLVSQSSDNYSQGKALSDYGVAMVVYSAMNAGKLPKDQNGVYFVLSSPDVTETSGFGTRYCGWHSYFTVGSAAYKFSFVGNAVKIAPSACGVRPVSPNGDPAGDAMASILFHELSETVTDPMLNAWYDTNGQENGDKCAWKYGTTFTVSGATANVKLGGKNWLIQQNWLNTGGGSCSSSY